LLPAQKSLFSSLRIYKVIILPAVLYGCETCSLYLREEHRLRVFENRVLMRIFGPKRDEMTGEWRKLCNEELRDLYSSPSIIRMFKSRRMRWAWHVARVGRRGTRISYWWESQRERNHMEDPRRRWVDNIKMDLGELSSIQPRLGRRGEGSMEGMEVGGEVPPPQ
jgi:hypothetical protein